MTSYLLDTNLLVRSCDPAASSYVQATNAVSSLLADGEQVYVSAQNLIEFWAVATRPILSNGLGLDREQAILEIEQILNQFALLQDNPTIFAHWWQLVTTQNIAGKRVHDARLVAVMLAYGITHLLTFNTQDFKSFTTIALVHPEDVN